MVHVRAVSHAGLPEGTHLDQPVPVACSLCAVDDSTVVYGAGEAQESPIVRCRRCGLMYCHPRARILDSQNAEGYAPAGLLLGVRDDVEHEYRHLWEKQQLQLRDFRDTRAELNARYPGRGRVLEIGSSLGLLLDQLRGDGWQTTGLEPWAEAAQFAQEKLGLDIVPATLDNATFPDASFDVVIMLHVIEHVGDPLTTLREIHRILRPGGTLVMETPRYDTLTHKLLKRRERSLSCEGHQYFFTVDSLRRTYERAGFREQQTRAVGRSLTLGRFFWNLGVMSKSPQVAGALDVVSNRLQLGRVPLYLNVHDMMRVTVTKPS
jgi:SAM-dependent methyltransferase